MIPALWNLDRRGRVGYIVAATGSFDGALVFVGAHCFLTIVGIAGPIRRVELG